ncbi:MAG: FHA domain-containing protein [Pyrinomonadaceae bacterium]
MNDNFVGLALQEIASDNSMWIILAVVLVILFFIVVIVGVGLTIFFISRKRSKAQKAAANSALAMSGGVEASVNAALPIDIPAAGSGVGSSSLAGQNTSSPFQNRPAVSSPEAGDFDPTRTVAIPREPPPSVSYGTIRFTSGVLAGQQFDVNPEGSYIGRESSLSQIVVSDPRISKRHLWIGVREGLVKIEDQDSRNGTFVNDPRSQRVIEATLSSGDTVILGESDVARFEYQA